MQVQFVNAGVQNSIFFLFNLFIFAFCLAFVWDEVREAVTGVKRVEDDTGQLLNAFLSSSYQLVMFSIIFTVKIIPGVQSCAIFMYQKNKQIISNFSIYIDGTVYSIYIIHVNSPILYLYSFNKLDPRPKRSTRTVSLCR